MQHSSTRRPTGLYCSATSSERTTPSSDELHLGRAAWRKASTRLSVSPGRTTTAGNDSASGSGSLALLAACSASAAWAADATFLIGARHIGQRKSRGTHCLSMIVVQQLRMHAFSGSIASSVTGHSGGGSGQSAACRLLKRRFIVP